MKVPSSLLLFLLIPIATSLISRPKFYPLSKESFAVTSDIFCFISKMRSDSNENLHKHYHALNEKRAAERRRGEDGGRYEWMRRSKEGDCGATKERYFWDLEMAIPLADTVFLTDTLLRGDQLNKSLSLSLSLSSSILLFVTVVRHLSFFLRCIFSLLSF